MILTKISKWDYADSALGRNPSDSLGRLNYQGVQTAPLNISGFFVPKIRPSFSNLVNLHQISPMTGRIGTSQDVLDSLIPVCQPDTFCRPLLGSSGGRLQQSVIKEQSTMTTNALSVFNFQEKSIRVVLDDNGTPMFVAKDIADSLGYSRSRDAINQHCKGAVNHRTLSTDGGNQKVRVIYEPDVYRLIFGSKLESAIQFQDWVFEEVLPQIRKTGSYTLTINVEQQQQIKQAVLDKVHRDQSHYQAVYRDFYNTFNIPRYQELPASRFNDAMQWLTDGFTKASPVIAPQTPFFLSRHTAHEFDTRVRSLFDLAGLMADQGNNIAKVFQRQAKDLNRFLATEDLNRA